MSALYYTLAAITLYVFSDWLLQRIELSLGHRLEHRSVVFFSILLVSSLGVFAAIRHFLS